MGPRLAEVAERMGKPFMPHQRYIADVAFEINPETGLFAYAEVIVIGPRQATGKTELLLPVMTHRCIGLDGLGQWSRAEFGHLVPDCGPQQVLYTAQTADKARDKWRDVHLPRILAAPEIRRHMVKPQLEYGGARLRLQSEAMFWRNGSQWSPGATTGKTGGTGDTLDLGVIDEAWSQVDSRTELGMRPAMMTRPWHQLWVTSMIPGLSRSMPGTWKYLKNKRQVGRARVEADVRTDVAFFDFAAPGDVESTDPADPQTWWMALPGLAGRTVSERTIRQDFEAMMERGDLIDFCAEYLGWEPVAKAPRWTLVDRDLWLSLRDPGSHPAGEIALSVEVDEERQHAYICAAGKRADGHWHIEVIEPGDEIPLTMLGIDWLLRRVIDIAKAPDTHVCTVVIDARRPANSLIVPLRNAGIDVTTPNIQDVAGACGRFYDATGQEALASGEDEQPAVRLFHLGQPELDRAVAGARKLDQGNGAFTFVKKGSVSELGTLYGVALAMHGAEVKAGRVIPRSRIW